MISEGFAEFLSLKIAGKFISDSIYRSELDRKARTLMNFKAPPMSSIRTKNDYQNRELYVYYYAPLVFSAIEKEIGEEKMWSWIRLLLQSPVKFSNYSFFEETLKRAVNDPSKFEMLQSTYLKTDRSFQNALSRLGITINEPSSNTSGKAEAKTYYYFFFSRPMLDMGSPQNRVIVHTEIKQITCTPEELSKMAGPVFKQIHDGCENAGGCTSDFNTYDTMEIATAALQRWLKRWNEKNNMLVKVLK
jgi:hypothetical protein